MDTKIRTRCTRYDLQKKKNTYERPIQKKHTQGKEAKKKCHWLKLMSPIEGSNFRPYAYEAHALPLS